MTKAELIQYVGKRVHIYFKDGEREIYGTLGYADEFSAKHDYRKPNYFYIGDTSFKVSHVRKLEESEDKMQIVIDIPEIFYEALRKTNVMISGQRSGKTLMSVIYNAVANGTPLPKGHRGIVDLKNVQWAFDDAILEDAQRTGHVRATHDEIANILKTVPTIIEADAESED